MSQNSYNQGSSDANRGLGPANLSNAHWKERQDYNAGYGQNKK